MFGMSKPFSVLSGGDSGDVPDLARREDGQRRKLELDVDDGEKVDLGGDRPGGGKKGVCGETESEVPGDTVVVGSWLLLG